MLLELCTFIFASMAPASFPLAKTSDAPLLIIDAENIPGQLPRNFRTSQDKPSQQSQNEILTLGLSDRLYSGSSQFSKEGFKALLAKIGTNRKIMVIDLRQESHGFVNGIAISWYAPKDWINVGKNLAQVEQSENQLLNSLHQGTSIIINRILEKNKLIGTLAKWEPISILVKTVSTEKDLINEFKYSISYYRIPVTNHVRPSDSDVDRFLEIIKTKGTTHWLHIHCRAGDGRTTTFMAMYDMFINAKRVSFDDILHRQFRLGGTNLLNIPKDNVWKKPYIAERLEFLRRFYDYCHHSDPTKESWITYVQRKAAS